MNHNILKSLWTGVISEVLWTAKIVLCIDGNQISGTVLIDAFALFYVGCCPQPFASASVLQRGM